MITSIKFETDSDFFSLTVFLKGGIKKIEIGHYYIELYHEGSMEVWDNEKYINEFFLHLFNDEYSKFEDLIMEGDVVFDMLYNASYFWKHREELLNIYKETKSIGIFNGRI